MCPRQDNQPSTMRSTPGIKTKRSLPVFFQQFDDDQRAHGRRGQPDRHHGPEGDPRAGVDDTAAAAGRADGQGVSMRVLDKSQDLQKPACAGSEVCGHIDNRVREIESKLQDPVREIREVPLKYRLPQVDVVEISFNSHGSLREAAMRRGGKAIVVNPGFSESRSHQERAWKLIAMYEPRHVWLDLRQPWKRRVGTGAKELWPEQFILDLFLHQIERGLHSHLLCGQNFFEQVSPLLQEVQHGTLHVVYDPLELGLSTRLHCNSHLRHLKRITADDRHQTTDTPTRPDKPTQSQQKQFRTTILRI